jgi:presenilin-like A22 family membrane protease
MKGKLPILLMFILFVGMQLLALALVPLYPSDYQAFPNANDPTNPIIYVIMLLAMTGLMLVLIKYGLGKIIKAIFVFAVGSTTFVVLLPILYQIVPNLDFAIYGSIAIGLVLIVLLLFKPEWYVVNAIGFIIGLGAAILLGLSLSILPVLILLIVLAVYDAISVYKTKHMITLAEGVVPLKLPVVFVIPKKKDFTMSSLEQKHIASEPAEEREAMFMGVGDAVIPGILAVSAAVFLPSAAASIQGANMLVAIGTVAGSTVGFFALMTYVLKGNPQAGLPLLNGGAIIGYLLAYLLVFQNLSFGIVL